MRQEIVSEAGSRDARGGDTLVWDLDEEARKQARKQAHKRTSVQASQQARKQASKRASKQDRRPLESILPASASSWVMLMLVHATCHRPGGEVATTPPNTMLQDPTLAVKWSAVSGEGGERGEREGEEGREGEGGIRRER